MPGFSQLVIAALVAVGLVLAVLALFMPWFVYQCHVSLRQLKAQIDLANRQRAAMLKIWNRPQP